MVAGYRRTAERWGGGARQHGGCKDRRRRGRHSGRWRRCWKVRRSVRRGVRWGVVPYGGCRGGGRPLGMGKPLRDLVAGPLGLRKGLPHLAYRGVSE